MNNNILVSVIMPTYNRAALIGEAIESVLSQTYKNFEFIIINDASTDETERIVLSYQRKDRRIFYLKNETNLKIQKSLNRGLKAAQGIYIARIDDDDVWIDRRKLRKQVDFLEKNSDYVIVGAGNIAVYQSQGLILKTVKPEIDEEIRRQMLFGCPFLHPAVVYRRVTLDKVGFYDEKLSQAEDYDLWLRLGKVGKMYNLPEYSIKSLVGASNVGHHKRREILEVNLRLIKKYRYDYPGFYRAYFKNYLEYLDASCPVLRKFFWPVYKIRRLLLNKFSKKYKVIKL